MKSIPFSRNQSRHPVCLHDGVGLEVGRLLHEASHQQHGLAFGLHGARVHQGLIIGEALSHALLQDDQGLVNVALMTDKDKVLAGIGHFAWFHLVLLRDRVARGFYLRPQPLGLLSDQLGQVCVLCVQQCVEGGLMVSSLPGHTGTLQPALPNQLLACGPTEKHKA